MAPTRTRSTRLVLRREFKNAITSTTTRAITLALKSRRLIRSIGINCLAWAPVVRPKLSSVACSCPMCCMVSVPSVLMITMMIVIHNIAYLSKTYNNKLFNKLTYAVSPTNISTLYGNLLAIIRHFPPECKTLSSHVAVKNAILYRICPR